MPPLPKKGGVKHVESATDLETGPLLDKEEEVKQPAPQDVPGRLLGLPIQLVAGIFYCSGQLSPLSGVTDTKSTNENVKSKEVLLRFCWLGHDH